MDRAPDLSSMLLEAHRRLAAELADSMAERGYDDVRPGHGAVFLHVDRRAGTRLGELARRAGITKQSMMQVVDDLEARGYVRRVPDPADARAKLVRLTAEGRRCATEFRRARAGARDPHAPPARRSPQRCPACRARADGLP